MLVILLDVKTIGTYLIDASGSTFSWQLQMMPGIRNCEARYTEL